MLSRIRLAVQRTIVRRLVSRTNARVEFDGSTVRVEHVDGRAILLPERNRDYAVDAAQHFETYWNAVEDRNGVLDFRRPAVHTYRDSGLQFLFPGSPEEPDAIDAYYHRGPPRAGATVFDCGAYAGVSAYHFSHAVGPSGRVIAFEPDPIAFNCLTHNIQAHGLTNVVPIRKAIAGTTGVRLFNADHAMGASFADIVIRGLETEKVEVACLTLGDACTSLGVVPDFVKIDIEGAELEAIGGALDFLPSLRTMFAIDSSHVPTGPHARRGERNTAPGLERLFRSAGYRVESNDQYRLMTTWAWRD
jgi:FkbM family methyltransferase